MPPSAGPRFAPPIPEGYKVLGKFERSIAKAISMTIFPPGGPIPYSGEEIGVSRYLDSYLYEMPKDLAIGMRLLMIAFEMLPLFFIFRFSRFSTLSDADRERYMEAWQGSGIFLLRAAVLGFKSICCFGYYADVRVREAIGYYVVCVNGERRPDI